MSDKQTNDQKPDAKTTNTNGEYTTKTTEQILDEALQKSAAQSATVASETKNLLGSYQNQLKTSQSEIERLRDQVLQQKCLNAAFAKAQSLGANENTFKFLWNAVIADSIKNDPTDAEKYYVVDKNRNMRFKGADRMKVEDLIQEHFDSGRDAFLYGASIDTPSNAEKSPEWYREQQKKALDENNLDLYNKLRREERELRGKNPRLGADYHLT